MVVPTLGADVELSNAWTGNPRKNNLDAASKVVREVDRMDAIQCFSTAVPSPNWQGEWGRHGWTTVVVSTSIWRTSRSALPRRPALAIMRRRFTRWSGSSARAGDERLRGCRRAKIFS